jgi:hypothetical protein
MISKQTYIHEYLFSIGLDIYYLGSFLENTTGIPNIYILNRHQINKLKIRSEQAE